MNRLLVIVGPTAVGKSRLALRLAQEFNGEIIGADSRQVYRYLDIGTAKPERRDMSLVPHHLIDIITPDQDFSLAQYQQLAYQVIEDIQGRDRLPLLVGGSGQYIRAVLEGWGIPAVAPDPEFRRSLEERAAGGKADELYRELAEVDPVAAERIDRHNLRRVIRALEVTRSTGTPFSSLTQKTKPSFDVLVIGLTADRAALYRRIDSRVDKMMERGLVEEVRGLMARGYSLDLPSLSGIGYKEVGLFLRGELTLPVAIQQTKFETHRYVRQQYSWFRLKDSRIKWFDIDDAKAEDEIRKMVGEFLSG